MTAVEARLVPQLLSAAVDALAVMRLTRLVTTDVLGDELIVKPAKKWAGDSPSRIKLVDGFECAFCIGFWIGLAVIVLPIPTTLKRALALNYLCGHVSSRLD